jgi:hypothetical protein
MRAYVQQVKQEASIFLAMVQASHWFWQRGYEVVRFEFEDIALGKLDDDLLRAPEEMVVRGGVETIKELLRRAGRPSPPNLDLPASLQPWLGRRVWQTTLGDARALVDSNDFTPLHVKPLVHHKLFAGRVIRGFADLISTAAVPRDTPVLAQECVEFHSEWRASILRDRFLNVGHYKGDPLAFPSVDRMRAALAAFAERPIGFGMDWGVTSSGETLLIEVNDGYALGNYGVAGADYTALIEARWRQLMGLPDNGVGIAANSI